MCWSNFPSLAAKQLARQCLLCLTVLLCGLWSRAMSDVSSADLVELEEEAMRAAAQAVAPSVVQIEAIGGLEAVDRVLLSSGPITGLVVDPQGYIVSSAFGFVQEPASILVTLPDGQRLPATVVARDHARMLVLIKVPVSQPLPVPEGVPMDQVGVGQWAIAVGRTFDPATVNVSVGIVSAKNRIWSRAIQTDAKISPANYGGPLVDIRGRVLGVLVPLSPDGQNEVAGVQWYDSGIGFAIPIDDVQKRLERLKQGHDIRAGLLGIALSSSDPNAGPVEIGVSYPNSPARAADLKPGDRIVAVNAQPVERIAQLKHALGPLDAGDPVELTIQRDDQTLTRVVQLTGQLVPYEHAFLGILPRRRLAEPTAEQHAGVEIRYVFPGSPAEHAALQIGERLIELNDQPIQDAHSLRQQLAEYQPNEQVVIQVASADGNLRHVTVPLAALPDQLPDQPPHAFPQPEKPDPAPAVGRIDIKIPEEPGQCLAYIPESYDPRIPHALLVWLHEAGQKDDDALIEAWQELCRTYHVILLAPRSVDPDRWLPTESDFIRKTMDHVRQRYHVDENRIVVHGYGTGATMAYWMAFSHRELVRGVAAVEGPIPRGARLPFNEPLQRLAIVAYVASDSPLRPRVEQEIEALREQKFPVLLQIQAAGARQLDADQRAALARWIDTLDRI